MRSLAQRTILSPEYRDPVKFALALQIPIAILCLLTLDGGTLARCCGCAMLAFWSGAALIGIRRPERPRFSDVLYLRVGFLPLFALAVWGASWLSR